MTRWSALLEEPMGDAGIPFTWADVPGHLSYLIIAISYWLANIYWLRVTAVIGLALEWFISGCRAAHSTPALPGTSCSS